MSELPAGLQDSDVTMIDRSPNVTVFVDVGLTVSFAQVVSTVTDASFTAAIEQSMGMSTTLVIEPFILSSRVLYRSPSIPPTPQQPPPLLDILANSTAEGNTAEGGGGVTLAGVTAMLVALVGLCLLMLFLYCAYRRLSRVNKQLSIGRKRDASLLTANEEVSGISFEQQVHASMEPAADAHAMLDLDRLHPSPTPPVALNTISARSSEVLVVRFTARIRHNTAGEFRIQLMQEGSTGAKDDGAISVSLIGDSDVADDRDSVSQGDVVRQINGVDIGDQSLREVQKLLAGAGEMVELTLERVRGKPTDVMHISVETVEVQGIDDDDDDDEDDGLSTDRPPKTPQRDDTIVQGAALNLLDAGVVSAAPPGTATDLYSPENAQSNLGRTRFSSSLMRI